VLHRSTARRRFYKFYSSTLISCDAHGFHFPVANCIATYVRLIFIRNGKRPEVSPALHTDPWGSSYTKRGPILIDFTSFSTISCRHQPRSLNEMGHQEFTQRGLFCRFTRGSQPPGRRIRRASYGATITSVKKRPASFKRRKLSNVVRKAITSYYAEQEQAEIARAAMHQQVSMSSFVASAALKEARRLNRT